MIDQYIQRFDSCLVGKASEKKEWHAELVGYLEDARENQDLDGALERLGSPREAAAAFRASRPLTLAPPSRRWAAQFIDHLPLIVITAGIAVRQIASGGNEFGFGFPPGLAVSSDDLIASGLASAVSLIWSWVGLAMIEGFYAGRTPGKALLGLRAVSDDGTTLSMSQAFARRWSILFGPLAWVDWLAALFTRERQRLLDLLAHTRVVTDPDRAAEAERSPVTP